MSQPEDEIIDPRQAVEQETIRSWRSAGIPFPFCIPSKGLGHYAGLQDHPLSGRATTLHQCFVTGEMRRRLDQRHGMIFQDEEEELVALTARSVASHCRVPVRFVDILYFNQPRNSEFYHDCVEESRAIFVKGFYVTHYPAAFSDTERLSMEMGIRWLLDKGCTLFVMIEGPLLECKWWSAPFLKLISKVCPPLTA